MEATPPANNEVLQTEQSETPEEERPRDFNISDSHEQIPIEDQVHQLPNLTRRDSAGSVRSLRSYRSVRESLGKMHAYVDKVSKLDKEPGYLSKKQSTLDCNDTPLSD